MSEFEYSIEALNVKSSFYKSTSIIYVEGEDDLMFWSEIFSRISNFDFHVEALGGSEELDKYIKKISDGELLAIAARDSDYTEFSNAKVQNTRVIYTFGYSVENSLYTRDSIFALTKIWCKAPALSNVDCDEWFLQFAEALQELLVADIANATSKSGLKVMHDSCTQFMQGKYSSSPCCKKIGSKVQEVSSALPKSEVDKIVNLLGKDHEKIIFAMRGHFLASAVSKFICAKAQSAGKKISVSHDALYSGAIS